ncbi:hypothetical protein [Nocardioides antri]|uniref:hypothetical protein n=1 Tax=Nocardioides antri TaxID=2607659 RepID=UPI00165F9616|nr:hypothetical protein [Nocardioides antri]
MAEKKSTEKAAVGSVWEVPDPARVTRPDGSTVEVTGGQFVLSQPGEYTEESGAKVTAK